MASVAADQYAFTATGVLGDQRETMLQNQLLLRCELGKPMTRGYTVYPGETFRYGRPNDIKDGGAGEALRGWSSKSLPFLRKRGGNVGQDGPRSDRDFMELNKTAVKQGLTTARENYQFRATHDIRRRAESDEGKKKMTRRLPPTMVFGISTRPSTPVHELLEHKYQDRWLQERRSSELAKRHNEETKKLTPGKVYETRASLLRQYQVPVDSGPLWQLPKFSTHARPHLETFRSEKAKDSSFQHHKSDCISRRGVFGHGTYEQAKN